VSVDYVLKGTVSVPRFPGKYNAQVYNNHDPEQQFRIQCTVPYVLGDQISCWALPNHMAFGNQTGLYFVPNVGANVWVEFADGDPSQPIWSGGYPVQSASGTGVNTPKSVQTGYPNVQAIRTSSGHEITFNNNPGSLGFTITSSTGHAIQVNDVNKHISLTTVGGHNVILDDLLQRINMTSAGGHNVVLDDLNKKIQALDSAGNKFLMNAEAGQLKIQHELSSGEQSLMQTIDHSIQHVASKVGLGDTAANLASSQFAALNQAAMTAFESNLWVQRLNDLKALITAMIAAGVPNAGSVLAELAALAHTSIPSGSTIVRIAQAPGDNVATGSG
jgi:hypothetical protein